MDLVAVNNQIVLMRNAVRQAKVHITRKLTRNIKQLKNKKGTEEQVERNQRRAEHLGKEIVAIKELNADQVAKFALLNLKSYAEVVKKAKPDDTNRVMTRLAEHAAIRRQIVAFREKFPKWENELPYLLKMRLIRSKYKTKAEKPKTRISKKNKEQEAKIQDKKAENKVNLSIEKTEVTEKMDGVKVIKRLNLNEMESQSDEEEIDDEKGQSQSKEDFVSYINQDVKDDEEPQRSRVSARLKSTKNLNVTRKKEEKRLTSKTKESTEEILHPSWEAKRRLKQQDTHFQGTKLRFDE